MGLNEPVYGLVKTDLLRLQKMLREYERGGLKPKSAPVRRRTPGALPTVYNWAKTQAAGTATNGVISVKLCDSDGTVSGDAFNVFITQAMATTGTAADMTKHWPYLASGSLVRIEAVGDDWVLVTPNLIYVDKF